MELSTGEMLLLGGGIGFAVFLLIGVVCWAVLRKKRRTLLRTIEEEYQ